MEQDFFINLPPEITIDILSRLPVRTTVSCKCVRKSWHSLIETPEFVKSYKSVPGLAVFEGETSPIPYKVYELEDELNLENSKSACNVAFNFSLPQPKFIRSSPNGLLLMSDLSDLNMPSYNLAICNPVTREYINLPAPFVPTCEWHFQLDTFGFGVSKTTGQYKIVRVFRDSIGTLDEESRCQVYTLGTGLWRSIAPSEVLKYRHSSVGALLNGNFHWLASNLRGESPWISCFNLENELFSTFSPPHLDVIVGREGREGRDVFRSLFASRDCLGLCDNSRDQIVIWSMNAYGDWESWTKQFVFAKQRPPCIISEYMTVLKVFKDGDVMMKKYDSFGIACLSNKINTIGRTDLIQRCPLNHCHLIDHERACAVCYTPSFLRLKTFAMENVSSF